MKLKQTGGALVGLLMLLSVSWAQSGNPGSPAPKLVIKSSEFSAGDVKMGEVVRHTYTFRNEGNANLEIKNVALTCGCETVDYDKVVPPGKDGKLTLQVKTEGYPGGSLTKGATVTTNDPLHPSFDLVLRLTVLTSTPSGQVIGPFTISPSKMVSTATATGKAADMAVTIYSTGTPPAKVTRLVSDGSTFTFTLEPAAEGNRYVLRGVSSTSLPPGRHVQRVKVLTDSKEYPELELQFEAIVVLPLRASPASVSFERIVVTGAEVPPQSKFVFIVQTGGPALEIKNIESTLPFLSAELQENNQNRTFVLRVKFTGIPPKGSHSGTIVVSTNLPEQPKVEIQVTVNVS